MIINFDRNPKYSLFYIGYEILNYIKTKNSEVSIDELYKVIQDKADDNINIAYLYYALDWLFLMSMIRLEGEKILICY